MGYKISVIIPVYGVEKYLNKCIDSILTQTFTDFECILIDDCSKDNCPEICDKYAQKDKRIKIIHNKKNIGSSLSRKIGLEHSSGEYILYIDADDYVEIDILEKMYTKAASENLDMVYCDFYLHDRQNNIIYKKVPTMSEDFIINIKCYILGSTSGGFYLWNKMIKRSIYERIEFPKDQQTEDRYITTQTLFFSKKICYINLPLYHHQYNPISLAINPKRSWKRYKERLNNHNNIYMFLKHIHGQNMSVFEPELSIRQEIIKKMNPTTPKNIIKTILQIAIPYEWRNFLKEKFFVKSLIS